LLVREGRVTINGEVVKDPSCPVDREQEIRLDGSILREAPRRYLVFHKPSGIDCQPRRSMGSWIGDLLPRDGVGLEPAGRLDIRARGLMLVSNDLWWNSEVTESTNLERRYEILVSGEVSELELDVLRAGISIPNQGKFKPVRSEIKSREGQRTRISLTIKGGHYRQVRAALESLRHEVMAISRVAIGAVSLVGVDQGRYRDLAPAEVRALVGCHPKG